MACLTLRTGADAGAHPDDSALPHTDVQSCSRRTAPLVGLGTVNSPASPTRTWLSPQVSSVLLIILVATVLLCQLPLALASPASPSPDPSSAAFLQVRAAMTAGSSCSGSEGQWNCLTNSWQRCAAGQWSVVMQCAAGTHCTPSGLTNDFTVQADQGSSTTTSTAAAPHFYPGSTGSVFAVALSSLLVVAWAF
ncbi:hypothetical protein GQ53DRAFT_329455 [Thozetella sp. PMI_491]|nr:hypothetical protein GQ53DRAFT_329455 [Thozetella sp. PMI_491]